MVKQEFLAFTPDSISQRLAPVLEREGLQSQVVAGSWLEVTRRTFDILEAEDGQPYRVFVFLVNMQDGRYLSRYKNTCTIMSD